MKVAVIFGTRPEAIKMAPVVRALRAAPDFACRVWSTGQHRQMLDQVLDFFDIPLDVDLSIMRSGQSLNDVFAAVIAGVDQTMAEERPDLVLVHGDTTTASAAAVAAFNRGVPVGHVEAGLRSGRLDQPWPEEFNRRIVDMVSRHLFAPTAVARDNLLREGAEADRVLVTGNTVIDALLHTVDRIQGDTILKRSLEREYAFINDKRPLLLVTGHRRESFGTGFENICTALARLAEEPIEIVYPVHLNPNVQTPVRRLLANRPNIHLIDPIDYPRFVYLMTRAAIILTDSGGVQEEAPSLAKPVLVMRDVTERPEAIAAGVARLVGTTASTIVSGVMDALRGPAPTASNPYGDGRAAVRILEDLRRWR